MFVAPVTMTVRRLQSTGPQFASWRHVSDVETPSLYAQGDLDDRFRRWTSALVQQRLVTAFTHLLEDEDVVDQLTENDYFGEQLRLAFPNRTRAESAVDPFGIVTGQDPSLIVNRLLNAHNETIREEYNLMSRHLRQREYDPTVWSDWCNELGVLEARRFRLPLSEQARLQLIPRLAAAVGMMNLSGDD